MKDNLYVDDAAREKLMNGVKRIAHAVGGTMGTAGSNAIIEAMESPGHLMTNDGATILDSIVFADPIEDMGRKILREAVSRANKASGDGSSTACVLTAAILEEGSKAEGHKMDIKRSLEECLPAIEASIKAQTKYLIDENGALDYTALEQVATISAEDPAIGQRIAEIYTKIGKTGIIHWDISKTAEDSYAIGSGITVEGAGWLSPYMCDADTTGQSTGQIRIKNPSILITKQKISSANDLGDIAQALNGKEIKDLVVFADDIDPLVVPDLIKTRMMRGFRIVIVKMPVLWKGEWFEDLSIATGAVIVDAAAGLPLKSANLASLGSCANIVITKGETFLDGLADMTKHIADLDSVGDDDSKLRASRLNTKTARYFVGAQSDSALSYRRLKVEDAISAAYQALNGGIVAGGGIALKNVALDLDSGQIPTVGQRILFESLLAPLYTILENAGIVSDTEVIFTDDSTKGYDTRTGQQVDMFESGIVDPAPIVLNAIKNAISVAASILTAQTVILLPREEVVYQPMPQIPNR